MYLKKNNPTFTDSESSVLNEEGVLGVTEVSSMKSSDQFSTVARNRWSMLKTVKNKSRTT